MLSARGIFLGFSRGCDDRCGQGCSDQRYHQGCYGSMSRLESGKDLEAVIRRRHRWPCSSN